MGAHPYWYYVPYNRNAGQALHQLRQQEFSAGRYNPVMPLIEFPLSPDSPAPGPKHSSPDEALEAAQEDGTRSILDIMSVASEPDFCVAVPLSDEELNSLYGTTKPTRDMVENLDFLEDLDRGHCVYLTLYRNGEPDELLFAGYSFD
jgi:hypothetical protein